MKIKIIIDDVNQYDNISINWKVIERLLWFGLSTENFVPIICKVVKPLSRSGQPSFWQPVGTGSNNSPDTK